MRVLGGGGGGYVLFLCKKNKQGKTKNIGKTMVILSECGNPENSF